MADTTISKYLQPSTFASRAAANPTQGMRSLGWHDEAQPLDKMFKKFRTVRYELLEDRHSRNRFRRYEGSDDLVPDSSIQNAEPEQNIKESFTIPGSVKCGNGISFPQTGGEPAPEPVRIPVITRPGITARKVGNGLVYEETS